MDSANVLPHKVPGWLFTARRWLAGRLPAAVTLFLLVVAAVNYAGALLGSLPAWLSSPLEAFSSFAAVFLGIFVEAAPYLLLGTLGAGLVEEFLSQEELARWIPQRRLPGVITGSLLGIFFPVCECGVVPFTRRLMRKGVPVGVGVATMLAAPVLNPIVIASTFAAFGPGLIFWGRLGLTLLIATLTGLVFSAHPDPLSLLRAETLRVPTDVLLEPPAGRLEHPPLLARLRRALLVAVDEFFDMGRYLILGALLAAGMQTVVQQSALLALGQGPVLSVLVMVALAVLLSICSTVDAFIALAFAGAFSSGSLLAFLVFGPMVDIKSALMFLRVFQPRPVAYLVLLPLLMTLVATVFLNFFGQGW